MVFKKTRGQSYERYNSMCQESRDDTIAKEKRDNSVSKEIQQFLTKKNSFQREKYSF